MIVPSIDLLGGETVQLEQGKRKVLDAGDPRPLAKKFGRCGEIAVIDLDAALGQGSNAALIRELLSLASCRVGGGIRDVGAALEWLDAGASKVILGTSATPEVLSQLPRERVIAALDTNHGEVVVEGWRKSTGHDVFERLKALRDHVSGFLVTFVEGEGRLGGIDLARVALLKTAVGDTRLTVAGGIATVEEIAALDRMGVDAQVGMAIYTGRMPLVDALTAPLTSEREDGLWPTVVTDEFDRTLGLTWSSRESLQAALETGRGVYQSRTRGMWVKGETSGATQELLSISMDCDRDAVRFRVRQAGRGFCHRDTWNCWDDGRGLARLTRRLRSRLEDAPAGSYTARLLTDSDLLSSKLLEEARELVEASSSAHVVHEAADVLYFVSVLLAREGVSLAQVEAELDARESRVRRRGGDAKPTVEEAKS